jgi:hypothetical protein
MWTSDIADSDLITEEKANFLLAEAKEQLAATVQDAEALTKTGIYLLGGLLTLASGLVGVMATQFDNSRPLSTQKWGAILPLLTTIIYVAANAAVIMWSALSTKELDHSGNAPNNLATQALFQLELRLIKFAEAASYQGRIENNHRRNESVGKRINLGIKPACIAPLIYLTGFFVGRVIFPS